MDNPTDKAVSDANVQKPGMSTGEALVHIFDRYLQMDDDNYRDFESVGAGLNSTIKNFNKLDENKDGYLTTNELDLAENDPLLSKELSKSDKDFVAALRKTQYSVETLSKDTTGEKWLGTKGNGISLNDLQAALNQSKTVREDISHANRIRGLKFGQLDANRDEVVTTAELERQLSNPRIIEEERRTIAELKQANLPGFFGFNRTEQYDYARKYDGDAKYGVLRTIANALPRRQTPYK